MPGRVTRKISLGLVAALIGLAGLSGLAYLVAPRIADNISLLTRALEATAELNRLWRLTAEAEAAANAYVVTPDERALQQFEDARAEVRVSLENLRQVTRFNPAQQQRREALEGLIRERLAAWEDIIRARREEGLESARALLAMNREQPSSEALRRQMATMIAGEREPPPGRARRAQRSVTATLWTILLVCLAGIALACLTSLAVVGGAVLLVRRQTHDRDVAERKERETRNLLDKIMDGCRASVYAKDAQGRYLLMNRYGASLLEREVQDVLGKTVYEIFPKEVADVLQMNDQRTFNSQQPTESEEVITSHGKQVTMLSVEYPLFDERGVPNGLCGVATDITARKEAEKAMAAAKEAAERTSRFKDQFLSTMSHELRTPLNAVLGFSELLTDERHGPLSEKQRRWVGHVQTGGRHLLRLVNDILDLSRIEAGRLDLQPRDVSLESAFQETVESMRPLAERKFQRLVVQTDPGLTTYADPIRLHQILMNLVGNAVKFTPEQGEIELQATLADGKVTVSVRDSGPGIPAEEQKRIFEAFYRLVQTGQHVEGTGLGLAISQRLVELHGDTLKLDSAPGQGTRFYFSLPPGTRVYPEPVPKTPPALLGKHTSRVLIIEDDPETARLIESQLQSCGCVGVLCSDLRRAVEVAAEVQPAAITLDLLMEPVHGLDILAGLKQDPRTRAIPVIVITVLDQPAVGHLLGAEEYLIKPVDLGAVRDALARCLGDDGGKAGKSVLVVEDDTATREALAELLRVEGFAVATASGGLEARRYVADSLPEMVILDLLLPEVSGFELLEEWRSQTRTAKLPVLVLTGKDLTMKEATYLRAHTESLLCKSQPWSDRLAPELRRVLDRSQRSSA